MNNERFSGDLLRCRGRLATRGQQFHRVYVDGICLWVERARYFHFACSKVFGKILLVEFVHFVLVLQDEVAATLRDAIPYAVGVCCSHRFTFQHLFVRLA